MTPLAFEHQHRPDWERLRAALAAPAGQTPDAALTLVQTYRRACEHLALARARGYPLRLVHELEELTTDAHQRLYQAPPVAWRLGLRRWWQAVPAVLAQQRGTLWLALLAFWGPALAMGVATWLEPTRVLGLLDAAQVHHFEQMYSPTADVLGRPRTAEDDWAMFGYYVMHNIGIGFQCFAAGLLLGLGSLYYLFYNGLLMGAVGGYLTQRGLGEMFWGFVMSHAPFELTAIVLSGAAGLRLGQALLMPGRLRRGAALVAAGRLVAPVVLAVVALLVAAAGLEAFWSSSRWIGLPFKLGACGLCLAGTVAWLSGALSAGPAPAHKAQP